ncbi:MAG: hypothetical protein R6W78_16120 [Bacteroidales bacterium]
MKKTLLTSIIVLLFAFSLKSQNYLTGVGLRLGTFNGFTVKHFVGSTSALEGLLSFRWSGFVITGLYEFQQPVKNTKQLDWFVGGGAHIGFWNHSSYYRRPQDYEGTYTAIGFDFIIGLEYTFIDPPISLAIDWKPSFNLNDGYYWWGDGIALTARYYFK